MAKESKEEVTKEIKIESSVITFEMYCRQKKIQVRRWAGMRAYTKTIRATFEEWEKIFASY